MSILTKEVIQKILNDDWLLMDDCEGLENCTVIKEMARMALAAMDSEPVAYTDEEELNFVNDMACMWTKGMGINEVPLYRHAQQPVVPATLPCSVELKPGLIIGKGCKTETLLTALRRRADYNADIDAMTPEERAEHDASIKAFKAMLTAAPQLPGSEPATVPGKWIPVSERMPEDEQEVLTINKMGHRFVSFFDKHSGLFFDRLDAPAACCIEHVLVTHWMPPPCAPQEVK